VCPRTKKQLEKKREETRGAILGSALDLFAKNGYSSTTADSIARKAGVSKGLIFSYFKTKQDILLGVIDEGMQKALSGLNPVSNAKSPEDRLVKLISAWVETIKTQPMYVRLLLQLHLHDEFRGILNERGIEFINLYLGKLRDVFRDLGSNNPDLDCYLLGAAMDGFSLNYSATPELFPIDEAARGLIETFLNRRKNT
jgi:AcrR family transcriptional regulator